MKPFGLNAPFNEPDSDDPTSAPSISGPGNPNPDKKKKKPFGPKVRNPGALAAAISRAKRAHQTGHKYGS